MKLDNVTKMSLIYRIKHLKQTKGSKAVIEALETILDENKSQEDVKRELTKLEALIQTKKLEINTMKEPGNSGHVNSGIFESMGLLGYCYQHGIGVPEDLKRAIELYTFAAEQGNADAQTYLGFCYQHGIGVPKDLKRAIELYTLAASQGHAGAQYNLGYCYDEGIGVPKDLKRAIELYTLAANQGHAAAQTNLGFCYRCGIGVEKDLKRAIELYTLAANQGFAGAQYNLGFCYERAIGVEKDLKRAIELYTLAADQGYAPAQYNLGVCYHKGIGVDKDLKRAALLYQTTVQNGDNDARENLAQLLASSLVVIPNLDQAINHYTKNNDYSILGFCHQLGLGLAGDLKKATEYYRQAIAQNIPCYMDLLQCYQAMNPSSLSEEDGEALVDFYKDLEEANLSNSPSTSENQDKLLCLGVLYEKGNFNFEQNLYKAATCFQKACGLKNEKDKNVETKNISEANSINREWVNNKCNTYATLIVFQNRILKDCSEKSLYTDAVASLIAEYAFEPGEPNKP